MEWYVYNLSMEERNVVLYHATLEKEGRIGEESPSPTTAMGFPFTCLPQTWSPIPLMNDPLTVRLHEVHLWRKGFPHLALELNT